MTYSRIVGTGRYLPEHIMTNADLEKREKKRILR